MSPADIAAAELRTGLARRLAELGLVPPEPAAARVATLPDAPAKPADEARKAA
jgi:hypothetical protein